MKSRRKPSSIRITNKGNTIHATGEAASDLFNAICSAHGLRCPSPTPLKPKSTDRHLHPEGSSGLYG